ncbi:hypothetical protein ABZ092_24490 [Streptomyces bobili]
MTDYLTENDAAIQMEPTSNPKKPTIRKVFGVARPVFMNDA